jgi:hypothetical protein
MKSTAPALGPVLAVEGESSTTARCQAGVGQVGAGPPNAVFHRGWTMKQGRSGSGSAAGAGWAAKVVVMATKLVAAAIAVVRRNDVAMVFMVVSSGCRADGPVMSFWELQNWPATDPVDDG